MAPASKILSIRVPPEIADELAELAAADGRTLSQFCARILTAAVADRAAA
jgi:predicted HicB family RNase H-like nuclease